MRYIERQLVSYRKRDGESIRSIYCRYNYRKTITLKKIIGKSPAILEAVSLAQKVAKTDASVLQTGETGTRKYVFARLIHNDSQRSG